MLYVPNFLAFDSDPNQTHLQMAFDCGLKGYFISGPWRCVGHKRMALPAMLDGIRHSENALIVLVLSLSLNCSKYLVLQPPN